MKLNLKKLFNLKNIVIFVIVAQAIGLIYFFGGKYLGKRDVQVMQVGATAMRNYIYSQVDEFGQVKIANDNKETMILIKLIEQ